MNDGEPDVTVMPPVVTVTEYDDVVAAGVVENVNVSPLFPVVKEVREPVPVPLKSVDKAVVAPDDPETRIVHVAVLPRRNGLLIEHESVEAVVGLPYTMNDGEPLKIGVAPTLTLIT